MTVADKADSPVPGGASDGLETLGPIASDIEPPTRRGESRKGGDGGGLSSHTQMRLGHQLKSLYDNLLQQPVPDRFRDLIDQLETEKPKTP